ncbi:MAG: Rieske 2Fe-2S domain-containing protein [Leptolyngbya sp. Prado105]|nr:Rieske 2Fe-2S domain-containing protein [Leptolyngbya sp. Prado105]
MTVEVNQPNPSGDLESQSVVGQQFNWLKQWYPVSPLTYLDSSCPTTIAVLGKKLVVWQYDGQWAVMDDVCPHKLTQLSLGKIQPNGTLACRQHGWCFDLSGQCVKIPMIADSDAQSSACRNVRAQVNTYPTQVEHGLLWVWLDHSSAAWEECQQKQPAMLSDPSPQWAKSDWYMVEVPVGYTVSIESNFDPSHAQFLHEGVGAFSPASAIPMDGFELVGEISAEGGFVLKHGGYNLSNQGMEATRSFRPPCATVAQYRLPTGATQTFQIYFVPTAPGHCRYIGKFLIDAPATSSFNLAQQAIKLFLALLPRDLRIGLPHLMVYRIGDQDLAAMYAQTQNEATTERKFFLPSPADQGILALKTWLNRFGGGTPAFNTLYSERQETLSDDQLYDRWHRHTKLCPDCRRAVEWMVKAQKVCQWVAIAAVVLGIIALLLLPLQVGLGCLAIALLSILGQQQLVQLQRPFISSLPLYGIPTVKLY